MTHRANVLVFELETRRSHLAKPLFRAWKYDKTRSSFSAHQHFSTEGNVIGGSADNKLYRIHVTRRYLTGLVRYDILIPSVDFVR